MVRKLSVKKDSIILEKSEFVNSVAEYLKTPISTLKYCYLCKPFFYSGSAVPRYSITLLFDKKNKEQKQFLESLEKIATKQGIETIGYLDDGLISIKFQAKEQPYLYSMEKGQKKLEPIELGHDLPEGFKASVEFELNTYFNKTSQKKAFNYYPKKVIFYVDSDDLELKESEEN